MPRGDRTGPRGMGPMTGRTSGYCFGYGMPGFANPATGQGFRAGLGRGRGFWSGWGCGSRFMNRGARFSAWMPSGQEEMPPVTAPTPEAETRFLQGQAEALQSRLDEIRKRLGELASQ